MLYNTLGVLYHTLAVKHPRSVIYQCYVTFYNETSSYSLRFEVSFEEIIWKCKAFDLKKIKIIAESVAAMATGGPMAGR